MAIGAGDVGRERHVPETPHERGDGRPQASDEAPPLAQLADHLHARTVRADADESPDPELAPRADQRFPEPLFGGRAEEEDFGLASAGPRSHELSIRALSGASSLPRSPCLLRCPWKEEACWAGEEVFSLSPDLGTIAG